MEEAGLANMGRSSLCRGTVFGMYTSRGEATVGIFLTHGYHSHSDQREALPLFEPLSEEGFITARV